MTMLMHNSSAFVFARMNLTTNTNKSTILINRTAHIAFIAGDINFLKYWIEKNYDSIDTHNDIVQMIKFIKEL